MKAGKFRYAAWGVLIFNLAVVAWGAFVRASFSGDGCGTHWPTCHGEIIPPQGVVKAFIEYSHRLSSGIDILLIVGLVVWAFYVFPPKHWARRSAVYSVIFIFSEALVGAGLVLFRLVTHNESIYRALALSLHLMNTFVLLAFLFATAWAAGERFVAHSPQINWYRQGAVGWILSIGLALMLITGVMGSIAALGDMLFPSATLAAGLQADFSPLSSLWVRLRWLHPAVAIGTSIYLVWSVLYLKRAVPHMAIRKPGKFIIGLVGVQLLMGILNWLLMAPIPMQLIHLFLADSLWLALIWLVLETIHANNSISNEVEWYKDLSEVNGEPPIATLQ